MFCRAVIQAVLLFGSESWALSDAMMRTVDSTPLGFLCQITGKQARRKSDGSWETPEAEEVLRAMEMQLTTTQIRRWQEKVAEWVSLQSLLEVYAR